VAQFHSTVAEVMRAYPYTRLPYRLEKLYPELARLPGDDDFGLSGRLAAVCAVLRGRNLGTLVDLGGHSGFFSMSLIDAGMADGAIVYDTNRDALSAGRTAAEQLNIATIEFVEQRIDFQFLKELPAADTILCLNLLHHAGTLFDADIVSRDGWEKYAEAWLEELGRKANTLILSLAFKRTTKPPHWSVARPLRPLAFAQMAERAGWSVAYEANVGDIRTLGVRRANRRFTASQNLAKIRFHLRKLRDTAKRLAGANPEKMRHYHLYILERSKLIA
jgi:hypothetical protein